MKKDKSNQGEKEKEVLTENVLEKEWEKSRKEIQESFAELEKEER